MKQGDPVRVTVDGRVVDAMIVLASANGGSLMIRFEAILDGCVGMMPLVGTVRIGHDGGVDGWDYHNLMTGRPVLVEAVATDA